MATKKSKKLRKDQVESELRLIAAGADGWCVHTDDDRYTTLLSAMSTDGIVRLCWVIRERWFGEQVQPPHELFSLQYAERWESFESLAAWITETRNKIDARNVDAG